MQDVIVNQELIGRSVVNAAKREWGPGKVVRIQKADFAGQPAHRVTVEFQVSGRKTLLVPPARLVAPSAEPERKAGWLDELGRSSLDDQLRSVPEDYLVLGTPEQRFLALAPLYGYDDAPASLIKWARRQTPVADPLSHWSRDELSRAFADFCVERDAMLRNFAAVIRQKEGVAAVKRTLSRAPEDARDRMASALRRVL